MTVQTLLFIRPQAVRVQPLSLPDPGPGEVRVETILSGISAGTEMLVFRGQLPADLSLDATIPALQQTTGYPLSYGYCAVGRVVLCGPDVDEHFVGQLVFAFQPHQSAFNAAAADLLVLPVDLPPDDAVFLPNIETALGLVMDAAPLAGERVAVLGQGIVGLLTTALLSGYPLDLLTTFDHYPLRRTTSLEIGARASQTPDVIPADIARSFDLVLELTGSPAALDTAVQLAGREARIIVGSWYGTKRAPIDLGGHFHRGRLRILSSQVSSLAPGLTGRWTKARRMEFAMRMAGQLRPSRFITHRFPLENAAEAYRLLDQSPESCLQVVFDYV